MRIGVATFGSDRGRCGIGRYIVQLLRQFAARDRGHQFEVMMLEDDRDAYACDAPWMRPLVFPERLRRATASLIWHQLALPRLCRDRGYDVLWLTSANRRLPYAVPCPTVGTVHDLAAFHLPGKYDRIHEVYARRILPRLIGRLDRVITVSRSTRDDVIRHTALPAARVDVIPLAADPTVFHPRPRSDAREVVRERFGLLGPYVLCVARLEHPGKNHVRLIRAFARLKAATALPHCLVLAGTDCERSGAVHGAARGSAARAAIHFTGFVRGEDLPSLYAAADLCVVPSLFEGFGLPVLEAMACGSAVACANVSSLPEVAGDAALLFDPHDEASIEDALRAALTDEALRVRLAQMGLARARAFCWSDTAERTLRILEDAGLPGRADARVHAVP